MLPLHSKPADLEGPRVPLRVLVILFASGVMGLSAAVPAWFATGQLFAGVGGPLTPAMAALVLGGAVFAKTVRALGRIVE